MPACSRRSTPSVHALWQERMSPRSCAERKSSRGRFCSVALAIASFLVLVAVLAIAGMALYMSALHTDPPTTNNIFTFSCSAKILRGDRFINALQEKSKRYSLQLESLYQRSVLGPGLVSCTVEKFGNDTITIFFKLTFNKINLPNRSLSNIEKTIRDILITDAISRKPVFRTVRFDPKSIEIHLDSMDSSYQRSYTKPKEPTRITKTGVVLKTPRQNGSSVSTSLPVKKKINSEEIEINEDELPVVQGSFKISKTDADITEKKTDQVTARSKVEKPTTLSPKKVTVKDTSITSALYKIAAIEKVNKFATTSSTSKSNTVTTPVSSTSTATSIPSENPPFVINPTSLFSEGPWIPILPNLKTTSPAILTISSTTQPVEKINQQPVYTSFTNPGLSNQALDVEHLGTTSLKSHPIPVNKIVDITEPSIFKTDSIPITDSETVEVSRRSTTPDSSESEQPGFVEVETVKYIPGSNNEKTTKKDQILKNISSIFHDLVSNLPLPPQLGLIEPEYSNDSPTKVEVIGQGQVEVVDGDEETLMMQTTKLPLVTLIPVKSNSGIGRPLRKRPYRVGDNSTNLSIENRSFPGSPKLNDLTATLLEKNPLKFVDTEVVTSISSEINKVKVNKESLSDFKIVGVLNFATETSDVSHDEFIRNPKKGPFNKTQNDSEVAVYMTNSSVSSNMREPIKKIYNILTPEKLKQLSEISNLHNNLTGSEKEVISTKAISSSYTINHAGFKILTKTHNKINELPKDNKITDYSNIAFTTYSNNTECANFSVKCGDGQCLPETTKCNQLIDCNDGKDEQDCNCADYLRSQYLLRKICDGVVDCWDFSDENQCGKHKITTQFRFFCIQKTRLKSPHWAVS